jgi:hypothetical protein
LANPIPPEALAVRLRRDLGIAGRVFNLVDLVHSMGFDVHFGSIPGGAEGLSMRLSGRDVIVVNPEGRSERRQRFTLAHELGHCLLRHLGACQPHQIHGHTGDPDEAAANNFAAALLMPAASFRRDIAQVHPRMDELSDLADSYLVSKTAVALRYVRFTDDYCALVGVTSERCWLVKSPRIEGWWIRNPPPENSLIREHLSCHGNTTVAQTDAAVWIENFRRRTPWLIREEIAPAGPDSWLVVLSELPDPDDDPDVIDREAEEDLERRRMSFRRY